MQSNTNSDSTTKTDEARLGLGYKDNLITLLMESSGHELCHGVLESGVRLLCRVLCCDAG